MTNLLSRGSREGKYEVSTGREEHPAREQAIDDLGNQREREGMSRCQLTHTRSSALDEELPEPPFGRRGRAEQFRLRILLESHEKQVVPIQNCMDALEVLRL